MYAIITDMPSTPRFDHWVIVNTMNRLYAKHDFPSLREGARFLVMHKDTLDRTLKGVTQQFDPSRIQGMAMRLGAPVEVGEALFELAAQTHITNASGFQEDMSLAGLTRDSPFALIELGAKRIDVYEEGLIHGLLQTKEYMEAAAKEQPLYEPRQTAQAIQNKLERQRLAFEEGDPPEMRVILNEQTLLRMRHTDLHERQIEHMLDLVERYETGIYVLPISGGIAPPQLGSFTIMGFDHPAGFELAYAPSMAGALWIENSDQIEQCRKLMNVTLRKCIDLGAYANADKRVAEVES
jgi:hypothetical protein